MIENGRDDDACRQMDVLADEDHTHHLTPQEYYHHKSNWWLRSNKTGSDTVPVERRPDFKQALSTLQQLKQKEEGAQRNQQWHRVLLLLLLLLHGGVGKVLGGLLILMKVTMEVNQVLMEQGNLLYKYLETSLQGLIFLKSFTLLQMDRLQLTAVYCNRRVCKYHVFAVQKVCTKWLKGKVMMN